MLQNESHKNSIHNAVIIAMKVSVPCFAIFGIIVGIDRTPRSLAISGLGYLFWPTVSMMVLGALVGSALGFIVGTISDAGEHATEHAKELRRVHEKTVTAAEQAPFSPPISIHLRSARP